MHREHDRERVLPEGVIDADPAGGWDGVDDLASRERSEAAQDSPALSEEGAPEVVESDVPARGADPDLLTDEDVQ